MTRPRAVIPFALWLGLAAVLLRAAPPQPPTLPAPAQVLARLERVADWQLAHPSRHPPTDWTQGAFYAGMMALARVADQRRYADAMAQVGAINGWQLGARPYDADDHCVGQMYAELYRLRHDPKMIAPLRERFDWILAHPKDGSLEFDAKTNPDARDRWSWCDSLFMGPPAWTHLTVVTGDRTYLDFAVRHWWQTSDYLYDKTEHLFFRDSTYFDRREANGRKVFWSRGNGWVLAGLVRVLADLPADDPQRERFVAQYREMAAAVLACQQPDGLWSSSLLDPADYPLRETSGSGFYCYALAWGLNHGLLTGAGYEAAVARAWQGLEACVTPEGRLTHVQPIGSDPRKFDADSTEVYGVGALLLAGSEVYRLAGGPAAD